MDFEMSFDPQKDLLAPKRFCNKINRTRSKSLTQAFGIIVGSNENDGKVAGGIVLFKAPAGLKSVEPGHLDIEENDIRMGGVSHLQRRRAIGSHQHLIPLG